jgi:hypothetical protein
MRLRSRRHLVALTLLVGGAAACSDDSPLLTGDPYFPDGRPVTLETLVPASEFLIQRGAFTGYTTNSSVSYGVIANSFDGGVTARVLARFEGAFPAKLEYTQDNVSHSDSLYTVLSARLMVEVDSSASVATPVQLAAHRITEDWQALRVTWTRRATDSIGDKAWATPGGSFEAAVSGAGTYLPVDSASTATVDLSQAAAAALRADSVHHGFLIEATAPNTRIQVTGVTLRLELKPSDSVRDTSIVVSVPAGDFGFIYSPEPPQPAEFWQAGTVRSARTLFSMRLPDSLTVCQPTCVRYAVRDLAMHRVSLMLRPRAAGGGFRLLDSAAVMLNSVTEVELGQRAPLGPNLIAGFNSRGQPLPARQAYAATDSLVEIPFTVAAAQLVSADTAGTDFALIASTFDSLTEQPFSLLLFDPDPRLRIVFTLPERPRLP